ncbi:MAG: hypothetical protein IPP94_13850 [Ignavibacteria bacterium]|nr:hypothetical protein [Ignavibacteria bacterium]
MDAYILWVKANPLLSAAIHFGLLGTLGELISHLMRTKGITGFGSPFVVLGKIAAWALLGVVIKYGFTGMRGFVESLVAHGMLPAVCAEGVPRAFAVSLFTNVLFGPQMMFFHRVEDNLILRRSGFAGMRTPLLTLVWFWIPAHTVTFSLPPELQIGLAAIWSVALGIILGMAAGKGNTKR